jgi:uncharacterized protein YkwD
MRSLAVLLTPLLVLVASIQAAPAEPASVRQDVQVNRRAGLEADVVRELNRVRANRGLMPLRSTPGLRMAARAHTQAMLDAGVFGHELPGEPSFGDRIRVRYPSRGWKTWSVGETLLASDDAALDATAVVTAWLDSPPHRAIVLSPGFRDVGVGALHATTAPGDFGSTETVAVTADFGLRTGRR